MRNLKEKAKEKESEELKKEKVCKEWPSINMDTMRGLFSKMNRISRKHRIPQSISALWYHPSCVQRQVVGHKRQTKM